MLEEAIVQRKYGDVKFVLDERIVDGSTTPLLKHYNGFDAPEVLDNPPEESSPISTKMKEQVLQRVSPEYPWKDRYHFCLR